MTANLKNAVKMVFENWMDYYTSDFDSQLKYDDAIRAVVQEITKSFDFGYLYPYIGIFFQDDGHGWIEIQFDYKQSENIFPVVSEIYQTLKNYYNVTVDYPQNLIDNYGCTTNDGWIITIKHNDRKGKNNEQN